MPTPCWRSFRAPSDSRRHLLVWLLACAVATPGCSSTNGVAPACTLTGDWGLSVAASPSCLTVLPYGYGIAPRGGGRISLVQTGTRLFGTLYIFDTPSGTIDGTVENGSVTFTINFNGRNVGVLRPGDEPCHVTGTATGTTDGYCFISVKIAGEFACPYACTAPDHILILTRGRSC